MKCYQVIHKQMQSVVYEYWADAPYVWTETTYPWRDAELYETVEMPEQPAGKPVLDLVEGKSWQVFDFVRRLTIQEHAAVVASTDPVVMAFHDRLLITAAQQRRIYANDPEAQAGIGYLASVGILTAERAAEVLS